MDKLKIGDSAPEISGHSINMGDFKLSSLKGKDRVFLVFSRYFGCTLCQLDFKELLDSAEEIQKYGKIVYITQSGEENAKKFLEDKNVPFPIILDPNPPYPLYKAYRVGDRTEDIIPKMRERALKARSQGFQHGAYEGNEQQCPANFIVSKEGKIEYANYGPLDLDEALKFWRKQ
jgi:peroxiredoxin